MISISFSLFFLRASQVALAVKNLPANAAMQETQVQSQDWDDPWRRKWQSTPLGASTPNVAAFFNECQTRKLS